MNVLKSEDINVKSDECLLASIISILLLLCSHYLLRLLLECSLLVPVAFACCLLAFFGIKSNSIATADLVLNTYTILYQFQCIL